MRKLALWISMAMTDYVIKGTGKIGSLLNKK